MNCPHHFQVYLNKPRSYKELPFRIAENGTCYRYEKSGELNGLLRVRSVTIDDTHTFIRHSQTASEIKSVLTLVLDVFAKFGFADYRARISIADPNTPEKYLGDPANWKRAEIALRQGVENLKIPYEIGEGEAAFYGPKIDMMVKDSLGRSWQLSTIQLDYNQPENFDMSYIDEMPKDRQKVQTWLVSENKRNDAFCWIAKKITEDCGQAFIICPLIEESEKETMRSVKAATAEYLKLKNEFFKDLKLSLLHGKIKSKEKERILDEFKSGKIDILVSTPVVEVGIDNPNAIIMVIEAAERFGLSQLHQLRGRVGRGRKKSYCLLFSQNTSRNAYLRIKTLEKIYNGAKLSEIDLKFRGPGAIFGTLQHGFLKLKIASLNDFELIDKVNKAVQLVLADKNCLNQLLQNKKITLAGKAVAN